VKNKETYARVLVLDLDSVRMGQELRGVWRPAFDYVISVPLLLILSGFILVSTRIPLVGLGVLLIMVILLWLPYRRRVWQEPQVEAFVRTALRMIVETSGEIERFEIEASARPGRQKICVGCQFRSGMGAVYRAFLNTALARQFLFATTNGTMVRAEINARVGGEFIFVDRRDGVDVLHKGIYTDLYEPTLLSFDFSVPQYSAATATVVIKLSPTWPGCHVLLVCDGVLPEYAEQTRDGWERILAKAARVIDEASQDAG
jgi:uncharacterized protein YndB with AHSA1/START domain